MKNFIVGGQIRVIKLSFKVFRTDLLTSWDGGNSETNLWNDFMARNFSDLKSVWEDSEGEIYGGIVFFSIVSFEFWGIQENFNEGDLKS